MVIERKTTLSAILRHLVREGRLEIKFKVYDLETGKLDLD